MNAANNKFDMLDWASVALAGLTAVAGMMRATGIGDPAMRGRVLFGSDYFMIENERFEKRLLSMRHRALLGEDLFWQIADVNPRRYLGEA